MEFVSRIVAVTLEKTKPAFDGLSSDIRTLDKRLAELEERKLDFKGTWQRNMSYERGDLVIRDGSTFISNSCNQNVDPQDQGKNAGAWNMFTQRGKDGRDRMVRVKEV